MMPEEMPEREPSSLGASVLANAVGDDEEAGRRARELLRAHRGLAAVDIPLVRISTPGLVRRAFELRANVTAYDACYVALAEALGWPLCTADRRLAQAPGPRCTMELMTPSD